MSSQRDRQICRHTIVNILLDCAHSSIPSISSTPRRLAGWNDGPSELRRETNFWHKVWEEAGCPSSGFLFNIKKNAKSRYKYAVRRIKRRQNHLVCHNPSLKRGRILFGQLSRVLPKHISQHVLLLWMVSVMGASKLSNLLNTHSHTCRDSLYTSLKSSLSDSQLSSIDM